MATKKKSKPITGYKPRPGKPSSEPVPPQGNPFSGGVLMPDINYKPGLSVDPQGNVYKFVWDNAGSYLRVWVENINDAAKGAANAPPNPGTVPANLLNLLANPTDMSSDALAARSAIAYCNFNAKWNESFNFEGWLNARKAYKVQPDRFEEPVSPIPYYRHVNYATAYALISKGQSPTMPPEYSWYLRPKASV